MYTIVEPKIIILIVYHDLVLINIIDKKSTYKCIKICIFVRFFCYENCNPE